MDALFSDSAAFTVGWQAKPIGDVKSLHGRNTAALWGEYLWVGDSALCRRVWRAWYLGGCLAISGTVSDRGFRGDLPTYQSRTQ